MMTSASRRYDKGERRRKHVGRENKPELTLVQGSPRRVIGKCPASVSPAERERLLNKAIPRSNGDRDLPVPKKVYSVYQGAIYEAQTSDRGRSYHAYPFKGKLSDELIRQLRDMADEEGCGPEFERWMKAYIVRHGK